MDSIFRMAREAASGREVEILEHAGISRDLLDGSHHSCPKCGGTDRFRFNKDNGSVFCNGCFKRSASKADVVSSVAWQKNIKEIDAANAQALKSAREDTVKQSLAELRNMMLTVVDGDFPRDVLANQNLTFAAFAMPADKNNQLHYDALRKAPGKKQQGILKTGDVGLLQPAGPARKYRWPVCISILLGLVLVGGKVLQQKSGY